MKEVICGNRKGRRRKAKSIYPQMRQIYADDDLAARLSAAEGDKIGFLSAQICAICGQDFKPLRFNS